MGRRKNKSQPGLSKVLQFCTSTFFWGWGGRGREGEGGGGGDAFCKVLRNHFQATACGAGAQASQCPERKQERGGGGGGGVRGRRRRRDTGLGWAAGAGRRTQALSGRGAPRRGGGTTKARAVPARVPESCAVLLKPRGRAERRLVKPGRASVKSGELTQQTPENNLNRWNCG